MSQNTVKPNGSLIFLVALLMVVAGGGAAYLYVSDNELTPVEMQEQTAAANQGRPHPPRSKLESSKGGSAKPTARVSNAAH